MGWSRTVVCLSAGLATAFGAAAAGQERPNIVFIFSDDHGWQTIGAYGSNRNETPQIDRLAEEGMRFDRASVTNSICAPARAVILTGTHSHINGNISNERLFDREQETFPPLLQEAGYETALIGKYHLRTEPRGFDHYDVLINQGTYYNPRMIRNGERVERTGYTTEIVTDLAIEWLEARAERDAAAGGDEPFMLMVQHKAPHRTWDPGPDHLTMFDGVDLPEPPTLFDDFAGRSSAWSHATMSIAEHLTRADLHLVTPRWQLNDEQIEVWEAAYGPKNAAFEEARLHGDDLVRWKYQRYAKDYLRCVAAIDDGIGRILDTLDELGLDENTVVMYSSDQGWYLGEHGWYDKRWMYEESFRTPLLVRWSGVTPAGSVSAELVQNLDFAQTFLDLAGAEAPGRMQGRSLVPLLRGQTPEDWRESVYYRFYEDRGPHAVPRHEGVATKRHKLIEFYGIGERELYDLETDPDELNSVAGDPAYAEIERALEAELARLRDRYGVTDASDEEYDRHEDALDSRRALNRLLGSRPSRWGGSYSVAEVGIGEGFRREVLSCRVGGRAFRADVLVPTGHEGLRPGVMLLHGDGDGFAAGRRGVRGEAERLARAGFVVVAPDRFAFGDRAPVSVFGDGAADDEAIRDERRRQAHGLIAEGTSLLGVTMSELQSLFAYMMRRPEVHEKRVAVVGLETGGAIATLLGCLDEDVGVVVAVDGEITPTATDVLAPGIGRWLGEDGAVARLGVYPRPLLTVSIGEATGPAAAAAEARYAAGGRAREHHARRVEDREEADAAVAAWLDRWLVRPFAE